MAVVDLNPKFQEIMTTDKRYVICTGGRGSAKSFSVSTCGCLITYEKGHRILVSRYTMMSAEVSIIPEFEEKIELLGAKDSFALRKNRIINKDSGSDMIFKGIKSSSGNLTANLKSLKGVSTWILEEAEELTNEDEFDKIDFSIRVNGVRNLIILIMNPTTEDHWVWKRWFDGHLKYIDIDGEKVPISTHPDVLHIHTTYLENIEHLSPSFIAQAEALRMRNPEKYRRTMLGGWLSKREGAVFKNWVEGEFDYNLSYGYGLDYGFYPDPTAMVMMAIDEKLKRIYVKERLYKSGLSQDKTYDSIEQALRKKNDLIVCDTSEPRLTAFLRSKGLNIRKAKKHPPAVTIKRMYDYEIIVDPNSQNLKREFRLYCWNDKKSSTPMDEENHLMDSCRYVFDKLAKKRRGIRIFN